MKIYLAGPDTVKQFCRVPQGILLRSGDGRHRDILVGADQAFAVWGVVRWALHRV